jgi:hypothetical protein
MRCEVPLIAGMFETSDVFDAGVFKTGEFLAKNDLMWLGLGAI